MGMWDAPASLLGDVIQTPASTGGNNFGSFGVDLSQIINVPAVSNTFDFSPGVTESLTSGWGNDFGNTLSGAADYIGSWWGGLKPGTQGLLASVAQGAGNAIMASRDRKEQMKQYDKQREYERQMRAEDRAAAERMRAVPTAAQVGVQSGFKWGK